jgi:hypothetical protein
VLENISRTVVAVHTVNGLYAQLIYIYYFKKRELIRKKKRKENQRGVHI